MGWHVVDRWVSNTVVLSVGIGLVNVGVVNLVLISGGGVERMEDWKEMVLWGGVGLVGLGMGPVYHTAVEWTTSYIQVRIV